LDWLNAIGWLSRLTSGSVAGVPMTLALMVPVVVLLLVTRLRDSAATAHRGETGIAAGRPGWIARRRAYRGIAHTPNRIGIGYRSAVGRVRIDIDALRLAGYVGGAPGSGKTSFLRTLIQGFAGPVVVLDLKGSPDLADTVSALPGHVWEIGGPLKLDLLDPEPAILAQQLVEGEIFTDRGTVYRAIAEHACLQAAHVLCWRGEAREPSRIQALIASPSTLADAIRTSAPTGDRKAERWIGELEASSNIVREAFGTFAHRLGTLLDSPAGLSLGASGDVIRLQDVVATRGKLLMRLDPRYGAISRKLGAWMLVAMLRLAAELRAARWNGQLLFIVDEPRLLGHEGRHLADLFGTARDAGVGLVVADQGIAGLSAVHPDLPDAVMRSTGWQLVLRQGSATDADKIAALFGMTQQPDVSQSSDGRTTTRWRDEPRVKPHWLLGMPPGAAWLRVAPTGDYQQESLVRLQVARPQPAVHVRRLALPPGLSEPPEPDGEPNEPRGSVHGSSDIADSEFRSNNDAGNLGASDQAVRDGTERNPALDLSSPDGQKRAIYRRVRMIDGWRRWRGLFDHDGWPHMWGQRPYKLIYEWEQGPVPSGWTIDHSCGEKDCLDHLEAVTRGENLRRRHARERGELPIGHGGMTALGVPGPPDTDDDLDGSAEDDQGSTIEARRAEVRRLRAQGWSVRRISAHLQIGYGTVRRDAAGDARSAPTATQFAIALFDRYDRPDVEQRTVSLEDLGAMLTTFHELADKRRARCWSPTLYADGMTSRSNAGVAEVSALVFDLDRVPPELSRLAHIYWIGHTTWSHTPHAPRWRVVVPLGKPVPASNWGDVWQRARAALCPEADPSCKDASRQYYLPSCRAGGARESTCHAGALLDALTLPELAIERRPPSVPRKLAVDSHRAGAYMRKVIENLATAVPGSRNAALNSAAWTLGRWVAAGALDQGDVEDALYSAADQNGLVADDGQRQTWASIRSGLGKGLLEPKDLEH
jgi:HNH endonuclease